MMLDDDVAIVVNPADSIRRRFEEVKMKINLMTSKPFPGAFHQIKNELKSFDEQVTILKVSMKLKFLFAAEDLAFSFNFCDRS